MGKAHRLREVKQINCKGSGRKSHAHKYIEIKDVFEILQVRDLPDGTRTYTPILTIWGGCYTGGMVWDLLYQADPEIDFHKRR